MDNTKEFRNKEAHEKKIEEEMKKYEKRMNKLVARANKIFPDPDKLLDAMEGWITDIEQGFSFTLDLHQEDR